MKRLFYLVPTLVVLIISLLASCKKEHAITPIQDKSADEIAKDSYIHRTQLKIAEQKSLLITQRKSSEFARDTNFYVGAGSDLYVVNLDFRTTEITKAVETNGDTTLVYTTQFRGGSQISGKPLKGGLLSIQKPNGDYLDILLNEVKTTWPMTPDTSIEVLSLHGAKAGYYKVRNGIIDEIHAYDPMFSPIINPNDPYPQETGSVRAWLNCTGSCMVTAAAVCTGYYSTCLTTLIAGGAPVVVGAAVTVTAACGIYCSKQL
ncbi:hypothetical protein LX64_04381 [Chitinophaga skermanii]|uniref:Lipoprotein n=1 Tax=Chitinophaga skermanii TaxID=331697 RepID=A0A327Q5V8_9BACT|nr:hypothetical protein [Chitinophaga skermanii]RAI99828.1 hypothetical protein LX64_04381 [Chitinophaga skermanii]